MTCNCNHEIGYRRSDSIVNFTHLWESLHLILDAYHPEIRDEVLGMWEDAIADNADSHLNFSCCLKQAKG